MQEKPRENWHKRIWLLAWPIILSNFSVPLLGAVDTAVMGHLPDPVYLGAVAVGAMIFSFLYWGFGFLRMGTTGLTAQAWGKENLQEETAVFYRAVFIAVGLALSMVLFQLPIATFAFFMTDANPAVENAARRYFDIRIWGAPATLITYVVLGWFLGRQNARVPLYIQLWTNGVNIILDLWFVIGLGMDVEGVALATVIAETSGVLWGLALVIFYMRRKGIWRIKWQVVFQSGALLQMLGMNRDLFIRTTCLIFAFAFFTNQSAKLGDEILAVNAVLMIFMNMAAYGLDGFAHAAEALVGGAVGRGDARAVRKAAGAAIVWSGGFALIFSILFFSFGDFAIGLLTDIPQVRRQAAEYVIWLAWMPLVSCWCFAFDGIFIGATRAPALRNGMLVSVFVYILAQDSLMTIWGNHGLWASMMIFMALRGVTLAVAYPRIANSLGVVAVK